MNKKIKKIIRCNLAILIINILMFSNVGFHLRPFMGSGFFGTFIGLFTIFISLELLIKNNSQIFKKDNQENANKKNVSQLSTDDDFKTSLIRCMPKRNFRFSCETALKQLERMRKKVNVLEEILLQHFESDSITYIKFHNTIENVEDLFYDNLRKMISKMELFDQEEYDNIARTNRNLSTESAIQRNALYKEYIDYANLIIEKNENILVKFDELLSEISKLEDIDDTNIEELEVLQEVNELVGQIKYYKEALK